MYQFHQLLQATEQLLEEHFDCGRPGGHSGGRRSGDSSGGGNGVSYNTNYLLRAESGMVWVEGHSFSVGPREWVLIMILGDFAHEVAGTDEPQFLAKEVLIDRIEREYSDYWKAPIFADVDGAVYRFRKRLREAGLDRFLIETKRKRLRLSTPAGGIILPGGGTILPGEGEE